MWDLPPNVTKLTPFSVSSVALYFPAIFVHVNIQYINIKMFPVNVPDFNITY